MVKVENFFNKLASHIDNAYFPSVSYYRDNKENTAVHYAIELFNNGCLTYHELIKRIAKNCKETEDVIHSIVEQYIVDFNGYTFKIKN